MSNTVEFLHPRKLYSMLMACPSAETRAAAALEFVRGCTVAPHGFLFLCRDGRLELAASSRERDPSPELLEEVSRVWKQKKRTPGSDQTTIGASGPVRRLGPTEENSAWTSTAGTFDHRLLSVDRAGQWVPVGIAMLAVPESGTLLPMRHVHVSALCEALLDAGDVASTAAEPVL
jgi:hypothetical protein